MKLPTKTRLAAFDAKAINDTIQRAFATAGLDSASGPLRDVSETIRRALESASPMRTPARGKSAIVADMPMREVPSRGSASSSRSGNSSTGRFESCEFRHEAGMLGYKVYIPVDSAPASPTSRPMIVMLHGCTQSADDFAAGTRMNRLADEHGFLVVYPEQAQSANPSRCWNWFKPQDQERGMGEPAVIAGIVRQAAQQHGADLRRIFVAGLSAGAAMAVVLGQTYPDLFAGVGAHSGLPYGSAHDVSSALAAMKGGRSGMPGLRNPMGDEPTPRRKAVEAMPLIVFHGDRDHTVQASNSAKIVQQAEDAHIAQVGAAELQVQTHKGVAPGGRRYSRTVHVDSHGQAWIESWTLHGAGHAWSGGDASGSYTDSTGPDASTEMLRFFLALPRAGSA